jgi:hypothetical protein
MTLPTRLLLAPYVLIGLTASSALAGEPQSSPACDQLAQIIDFAADERPSDGGDPVFAMYVPPATKLRQQADDIEKRDKIIQIARNFREAMKLFPVSCPPIPKAKP